MYLALFKDSEASFRQALDKSDIEYEAKKPKPGEVVAAGLIIEVVQTIATSGAIAAVLVAWLRARASRKIILTLEDNKVVHLEGYSIKEVQQVLPMVKSAAIIDTQPADKI